ncbi:conserved hypothetical protein [Streptomyces sp. SPB78]|nr:conserved hypothetical protein [Streptomyces sp. SPB78]
MPRWAWGKPLVRRAKATGTTGGTRELPVALRRAIRSLCRFLRKNSATPERVQYEDMNAK